MGNAHPAPNRDSTRTRARQIAPTASTRTRRLAPTASIDAARARLEAKHAEHGTLTVADLYEFAQCTVESFVALECPRAPELHSTITEKVLNRLSKHLARHLSAPSAATRKHFGSVQGVRRYLRQSVKTNLIDARRQARSRPHAAPIIGPDGTVTTIVEILPAPMQGHPSDAVHDPRLHDALLGALDRGIQALPAATRTAIRLHLQGLDGPTIGARLGRTGESVRQLLSRGLRSVRTIVIDTLTDLGLDPHDIDDAMVAELAHATAIRFSE